MAEATAATAAAAATALLHVVLQENPLTLGSVESIEFPSSILLILSLTFDPFPPPGQSDVADFAFSCQTEKNFPPAVSRIFRIFQFCSAQMGTNQICMGV